MSEEHENKTTQRTRLQTGLLTKELVSHYLFHATQLKNELLLKYYNYNLSIQNHIIFLYIILLQLSKVILFCQTCWNYCPHEDKLMASPSHDNEF